MPHGRIEPTAGAPLRAGQDRPSCLAVGQISEGRQIGHLDRSARDRDASRPGGAGLQKAAFWYQVAASNFADYSGFLIAFLAVCLA